MAGKLGASAAGVDALFAWLEERRLLWEEEDRPTREVSDVLYSGVHQAKDGWRYDAARESNMARV